MHPALWLALAIGSEIVATTSLKVSDGFSKPAQRRRGCGALTRSVEEESATAPSADGSSWRATATACRR